MAELSLDTATLIEPVVALARAAGERIMHIYNGGFTVEYKDDHSPLTEADMAAHNAILAGLDLLTPDIPVLSEESADIAFAIRRQWPTYWLIDPLDGTREFIKRNGEFTVNIALIHQQRPVLGVIHVPVSGVDYFARAGAGAFKQRPGEASQRIQVAPDCRTPPLIAGSRSHQSTALKAFLSRLGEYHILSMGSSLKSCLVAEGKADLYVRLGLTSEWDTAAAQCIVEEAGGRVTDTHMQDLRYNTKDSLLNPHFFVFGDLSRDWSAYLEQEQGD